MVSMDTKKQAGFGVGAIIAAVLVIAGLGLIGWKLYSLYSKPAATTNTSHTTNSNQSNNQTSSTTTQQQTDPNAGYVVIKEWGVRFKPMSGLSELSYSITSSQRPNAVEAMLMTDQLRATTIPACNGTASGSRPLGAIVERCK